MRSRFGWMLMTVLILTGTAVRTAGSDDEKTWSTDRLDEAWIERVLADSGYDRGWSQSCSDDRSQGRVAHCEVREFDYPRGASPVAINGGHNGGMTVMGWDRDHVRVIYRVMARARTEERARALAAEVTLERTKGWLRPEGPAAARDEWWSVEVKAWVPRRSDLVLRTHNGPLGVRAVRGTMELRTLNGPLSLVDLGGAVEARAVNGPLHVALGGSRWDGAGLDASAENGPVNFVLPRDYSARIETGTINGPRTIQYALELRTTRGHFIATAGRGGPPVRVVTDNGPFRIAAR